MSDDIVNIEVDGKPVEARPGQMVIEVTDEDRRLRAAILLSRETERRGELSYVPG